MWQSLPEFGSLVLYAVLVSCAYTFAVAVAAHRDRLRWLRSARLGAYATSALVGVGVTMLAYALRTIFEFATSRTTATVRCRSAT
jgi:cytochrome c-type biogenesis protein CcmF